MVRNRGRVVADLEVIPTPDETALSDEFDVVIVSRHPVGPSVGEQPGRAGFSMSWAGAQVAVRQFVRSHPSRREGPAETVFARTGRGVHVG